MEAHLYLLRWLQELVGFIVAQAGSVVVTAITICIVVCLILLRAAKSQPWKPTVCDASVLVFVAAQIASTYCGLYRDNSLIYDVGVATAANIYFIFRIGGGLNSRLFRVFSIAACFLELSLAFVNIPATIEQYVAWKRLGLSDIISFRACFVLTGGVTKTDSLNLALALLPFSLILLTYERRILLKTLSVLSLIGSTAVIGGGMSRGVYLGALSLCVSIFAAAWVRCIRLNRIATIVLLAMGSVILASVCMYAVPSGHSESTNDGETSISKARSIDGRIHIWNGTLSHIHSYALFGVGGGNGALYTLKHIEAAPYEPFTARTYNCLLEILLQNGALGLIAFCVIVIWTLGHIMGNSDGKPHSRQIAVIAQGAIIGMLVSDLTYTSLVRHPLVMCLFFALAGALNGDLSPCIEGTGPIVRRWETATSHGIIGITLLTSIYFTFWGIRGMYSESEYASASTEIRQRHYESALQHLTVAENNSDCDALYASMEGLVYERSSDEGQPFSELWQRGAFLSQRRREEIQRAVNAYGRASICAPMDAAIHHNLGWLYAMLGNNNSAREHIAEAMRLEPNTGLYRLSSGLLYEREGNLDSAYKEYSEAIARTPRILDSEFFVQLKLRHVNEIQNIIEQSKDSMERYVNTPMRRAALARLSYQANDYTTAISALRRVLIELPNLSNAWVTLGRIAENQGDIHEAVMDYRRAHFTDPMNRLVLASLANADQATGEDQEGLQAAQMALTIEEASAHAMRSSRMYQMNPLSADDLVPFGMLGYTEPKIDVDRLCRVTYEMAGRRGVEVPSEITERISMLGGKC